MSDSSLGPEPVSWTGETDAARAPRRLGVRWLIGVAGAVLPVLSLTVGCNSLSFLRPHDRVADKVDQPAAPAADPASLPGKYSLRVAPYVFLSDFEIPRSQPLFAELADLRDQVYKELLLPPGSAVVNVYLFESERRYKLFMAARHPDLPQRRAFFIAQPRPIGGGEDLLVYTWWGDRIRQDLRHELTHALLHSVIKDVPLWLDEGLAEYFELPPAQHGVNSAHVDVLLRGQRNGSVKFNLARLESLKEVDQMNPAEYREAWAWVHLMLQSRPEARTVLLGYLQQLRTARRPEQIGPRLLQVYPELEETLTHNLEQLERSTTMRTVYRSGARREAARP